MSDSWLSVQRHKTRPRELQDVPRRKARINIRVRALVMTIGLDLPKQILNAQTETPRESQTRRCRRYDQEGYTEGEVGERVMLKVSPWANRSSSFGKGGS
ncbi:hypothetical protein Tco_1474049 [Tanacetum coccineum]